MFVCDVCALNFISSELYFVMDLEEIYLLSDLFTKNQVASELF